MWESAYGLSENIRRLPFHPTTYWTMNAVSYLESKRLYENRYRFYIFKFVVLKNSHSKCVFYFVRSCLQCMQYNVTKATMGLLQASLFTSIGTRRIRLTWLFKSFVRKERVIKPSAALPNQYVGELIYEVHLNGFTHKRNDHSSIRVWNSRDSLHTILSILGFSLN